MGAADRTLQPPFVEKPVGTHWGHVAIQLDQGDEGATAAQTGQGSDLSVMLASKSWFIPLLCGIGLVLGVHGCLFIRRRSKQKAKRETGTKPYSARRFEVRESSLPRSQDLLVLAEGTIRLS